MTLSDIFYLFIIPVLTAIVVGFSVSFYARMREKTRSKAYRERIAILDSAAEQLRVEMEKVRELADARSRLLQSWQAEKTQPLLRLIERLGLRRVIGYYDKPRGLTEEASQQFEAICEEVEHFRSTEVPIIPELALNLALLNYAGKNWDEAIALFEEVLEGDATNQDARVSLGNLYLKTRRFEDAKEQFGSLVELAGHRFEGYLGLGLALVALERFDEGISAFSTAIRLRPDNARTYCELGRAYVEAGELGRALESAQVALKLDPKMEEGQLLMQNILIKSGNFEEAVNACRRYLATGDSPRVHYNLAVAYALGGDGDAAIDSLRRAIQIDDELRFSAKDDSAFSSLRDSRRFQDLLSGKPGLF